MLQDPNISGAPVPAGTDDPSVAPGLDTDPSPASFLTGIGDAPVKQDTPSPEDDPLGQGGTLGSSYGAVFRNSGALNKYINTPFGSEEELKAREALDRFLYDIDYLSASPDTQDVWIRALETIDSATKAKAARAYRDAYESGVPFEVSGDIFWGHALRGNSARARLQREYSHQSESKEAMAIWDRIDAAPEDTRYRFVTDEAGAKVLTAWSPSENRVIFETRDPQLTRNPFNLPAGGSVRDQALGQQGLLAMAGKGVVSALPLVGERVDEDDAQVREWAVQIGANTGWSISPDIFNEDGTIKGIGVDEDADEFYLPSDLFSRSLVGSTAESYQEVSYLRAPAEEDENGLFVTAPARYHRGEFHEERRMPLLDIRPGTKFEVDGHVIDLSEEGRLSDILRDVKGGWLGTGGLLSWAFHDKDEKIDTPYGRMLVPNLTGNPIIDRDLANKPQVLRSLIEADNRYGSHFWTRASQEVLGLGEFVGNVMLTKRLWGAGAGATRRVVDRMGLAGKAAQASPVIAQMGRAGESMAKTATAGGKAVRPYSSLHFNPAIVGWMTWHEMLKGVVTGEGTPKDWVKNGVSGGMSFWAYGAVASGLGRLAQQAVGRGLQSSKLPSKVQERGRRVQDWGKPKSGEDVIREASRRVFRDPLYREGVESVAMSPAFQTLSRTIDDLVHKYGPRLFSGEINAAAIKHTLHSFTVGSLMGAHGIANELAVRDLGPEAAANFTIFDLISHGYYGEAVAGGQWAASGLAFGGLTSGQFGAGRLYSRVRHGRGQGLRNALTPEQETVLKNLSEYLLYKTKGWMADPKRSGFEKFLEKLTPDAMDAHIRSMLGKTSLHARDAAAQQGSPTAQVELLSEYLHRPKGPEVVRDSLKRLPTDRLEELVGNLRLVNPESYLEDGGTSKTLRHLAERELADRGLTGAGPVPVAKKKKKKKKSTAEEIPEDQWAARFGPPESRYISGGNRTFYPIAGRRLGVAEAMRDGKQVWVVLDPKANPKDATEVIPSFPAEYEFTSEGLHQAMGDALRWGRVLKSEPGYLKSLKGGPEPVTLPERSVEDTSRAGEADVLAEQFIELQRQADEARARIAQEVNPAPKEAVRPEDQAPVPEPLSSLQAQMDALVDRRKPSVLVTPGEAVPPIPDGHRIVRLPGNTGDLIVPEGEVGQGTVELAKDPKKLGKALGYGRGTKGPGGDDPTAQVITARDAQGRVVADIQAQHHPGLADRNALQAARKLAGEGGTVEKRYLEDAIAERGGPSHPSVSLVALPTPEQVGQAGRIVGNHLSGMRGFGGMTRQEIADAVIDPEARSSISALKNAVQQALAHNDPIFPEGSEVPRQVYELPPGSVLAAEMVEAVKEDSAQGRIDPEVAEGLTTALQTVAEQETPPAALREARLALQDSLRRKRAGTIMASQAPRHGLWDDRSMIDPLRPEEQISPASYYDWGHSFILDDRSSKLAKDTKGLFAWLMVQREVQADSYRARLQTAPQAERQVLEEALRVRESARDSVVAGMLVASGLPTRVSRDGRPNQMFDRIVRLSGFGPDRVDSIRQNMVNAGRVFDPLIIETINSSVVGSGPSARRLITQKQLEHKQGDSQPLFDWFRVAALSPRGEMTGTRRPAFPGKVIAEGLSKQTTPEQVEAAAAAIGGDAAVNAKAIRLAAERAVERLEGISTKQHRVSDIIGQISKRIAYTLYGKKDLKQSTQVKEMAGLPTLSDVAKSLVNQFSGADFLERAKSVGATDKIGVHSLETARKASEAEAVQEEHAGYDKELLRLIEEQKQELYSEGQKAQDQPQELSTGAGNRQRLAEQTDASPEAWQDKYEEAAKVASDLLVDLSRINLAGKPIMPLGERDQASYLGDPAQSLVVSKTLRMLALGDPAGAVRAMMSMSTTPGPDGVPEPVWDEQTVEVDAATLIEEAQKLQGMSQDLLRTWAKATGGNKQAKQVDAILEALESELLPGEPPLPEELHPHLDLQTKLFPNGARDKQENRLSPEVSTILPLEMMHWANQQPEGSERSSDIVPLFAGIPWTGWEPGSKPYEPVRVEGLRLRNMILGEKDPNQGLFPVIGRGRLADAIAQEGGLFAQADGGLSPLGGFMVKAMSGWYRAAGRQVRSPAAPSKIREDAYKFRNIESQSEYKRDLFFADVARWVNSARDMNMTAGEANLLGKVLMGGGRLRLLDKSDFIKAFPGVRPVIYDRLIEMSDQFNALGAAMVSSGAMTQDAAEAMKDRYFPMIRKPDAPKRKAEGDRVRAGYSIAGTGTPREKSRRGSDYNAQKAVLDFDARQVFPAVVYQEAGTNHIWQMLGDMLDAGLIHPGSEVASMTPAMRHYMRKATEPFGGKLAGERNRYTKEELEAPGWPDVVARRMKAKEEQVRLHMWAQEARSKAELEEKRTGNPMPARKREILEAVETGYVTDAISLGLDMVLDQADPTINSTWITQTFSNLTGNWRLRKTIEEPTHWARNVTGSVMTNHINDKVSMLDFVMSVTTGKGLYADAARNIATWNDWVRDGRPELEVDSPRSQRIREVDDVVKWMGAGTMMESHFGLNSGREWISTMFDPSRGGGQVTATLEKDRFVEAVSVATNRRADHAGNSAERFAYAMGRSDPRAYAQAHVELMNQYYMQELLFKYAATLSGMRRRGLSLQDAVAWGAEGTADYRDINPLAQRLTRQFTGSLSQSTAEARQALGKGELGARIMRMGAGSPFWSYRLSMLPTILQSMVDRPARTAAAYVFASMVIRALSDDDERGRLSTAMAGVDDRGIPVPFDPRHGWTKDAQDEFLKRIGDAPVPDYGGGMWWDRVSFKQWMNALGEASKDVLAGEARIPSGEGYWDLTDVVMPGLHEISAAVKTLSGGPSTSGRAENIGAIGFMPHAAGATMSSLWKMAVGAEGERRSQTFAIGLSNIAKEFLSTFGPGGLAGRKGQSFVAAVDGRTLRQMVMGEPADQVPMGDRLLEFGGSLVSARGNVSTFTSEPVHIPWHEKMLAQLGLKFRPGPSVDRHVAEEAELSRAISRGVAGAFTNAYRRFVRPENMISIQALVNSALDLGQDVIQSDDGGYTLQGRPETEAGRYIYKASLGDNDRIRRMTTMWMRKMEDNSDVLQRTAVQLAGKAEVNPSVIERMVNSTLRGENSNSGLVEFLHKVTSEGRSETDAMHDGIWVEVWDSSNLRGAGFVPGSTNYEKWNEVREWVEANRSSYDPNRDAPTSFPGKIFDLPGGQGMEALPNRPTKRPNIDLRLKPDISKIYGSNQGDY